MTGLSESLRARIAAAAGDAELRRNSPYLAVTVAFDLPEEPVVARIAEGAVALAQGAAEITVRCRDAAGWARLLAAPQPPLHNSLTALQIANPGFEVIGDPLVIARARAALDRLVECLSPVPPAPAAAVARDVGQITGRYVDVKTAGGLCRYYHEVAGAGDVPLVFLHTAGADSRQYHAQMSDVGLAEAYTLYAPDMPFHGRSMPPEGWDGGPYHLDTERYRARVAQPVPGPCRRPCGAA